VDSFNPISSQGLAISNLFWLVLALSLAVFLVVIVPLGYILVRFRARPGDPDPPQVEGNRTLEITWTSGAVALVVILFILTIQTMATVSASSSQAVAIQVIGHQWWWEYRYPDLQVVTADELRVPVGTTVHLLLDSADVVHSFWVPQFGWKKDVVSGRTNDMWVTLQQAGTFDGTCTEYCGTEHAWMRIRVIAQPRDQFDAWVQQQRQPAAAPATAAAQRGQQLFQANTCVSCHTVQGVSSGQAGPDLTHFGSRTIIGSGVLDNTPENLKRWVRSAQSVKPGVLMPSYDTLSDEDAQALAEYLGGLK
jgi:cytochrome c oxidase subunit 2